MYEARATIYFYAESNKKKTTKEFDEWYKNIKRSLVKQFDLIVYLDNRILFKKPMIYITTSQEKPKEVIKNVLKRFIEDCSPPKE